MERRRGREGIGALNSLLNQKVNWKSGEFRLPAERDRGEGGGLTAGGGGGGGGWGWGGSGGGNVNGGVEHRLR